MLIGSIARDGPQPISSLVRLIQVAGMLELQRRLKTSPSSTWQWVRKRQRINCLRDVTVQCQPSSVQFRRKKSKLRRKTHQRKNVSHWAWFLRFNIFHLVSKRKGKVKTKGFVTKLVQLYNIEEDPTEKKELSDVHPKLVNIMLTKLADYYVRQLIN